MYAATWINPENIIPLKKFHLDEVSRIDKSTETECRLLACLGPEGG